MPQLDLKSRIGKLPNNNVSHPQQVHQTFPLNTTSSANRLSYFKNIYNQTADDPASSILDASKTMISSFEPSTKFQITGLDTDTPLVRIDNDVLRGEWKDLIGTELILNEEGKVIATLKKHLQTSEGELISKEEYEKRMGQKLKKLNVFETALKLAKEKESQRNESK